MIESPKEYRGFIGVRPPGVPSKQEVLLFDSITMPHLKDILFGLAGADAQTISELQYLYDRNAVVPSPHWIQQRQEYALEWEALQHRDLPFHRLYELITRLLCIEINLANPAEAVPVLYGGLSYSSENTRSASIVSVTLSSLPVPTEDTGWEEVLDFKSDPAVRMNQLRLREWMRNSWNSSKSLPEIKDEIEYLIIEYQRHLQIRKLKYRTSTLKALIKIPLEFMEDLLKIKWGKLVDPFFALKEERIRLLEEEMKSPAKEAAYIVQSRERFQG